MRAPAIEVGLHLGEVDVEEAEGLGAVHDREDTVLPRQRAQLARGEEIADGVGQVGEGDHAGIRRDGLAERLHVEVGSGVRAPGFDLAHRVAEALALGLPGEVVAGVVVAHDHDFVALSQLEPGRHPVVGFAGVAGDEDLLGGDAQEISQAVAGRLLHPAHGVPEARHRLAVHPLRVVVDRLQGARGRRAQVGRVHDGQLGRHEETRADLVPIHHLARSGAPGERCGTQLAPKPLHGGMGEEGSRSSGGEESCEITAVHG